MKTITIIDFSNLFLSIGLLLMNIAIIYRTESKFDKAFKVFSIVSLTLVLASLAEMNVYFGLIPNELALVVFKVSRMMALIFALISFWIIVRMIGEVQRRRN